MARAADSSSGPNITIVLLNLRSLGCLTASCMPIILQVLVTPITYVVTHCETTFLGA